MNCDLSILIDFGLQIQRLVLDFVLIDTEQVKQKQRGVKRMLLPSVEGQEGGKWIVIDSGIQFFPFPFCSFLNIIVLVFCPLFLLLLLLH